MAAAKRKDLKGRVLRTGESVRKDGRYMYRFTDRKGSRHTIYADDLKTLRELESKAEVEVDEQDHVFSLRELIEKYLSTKIGVKRLTKETYQNRFKQIVDDPIMDIKIDKLTTIKLKEWLIEKNDEKASSTCRKYINTLIHPALEMALQDQLIERNPAKFRLSDVLKDDTKTVRAFTVDEQEKFFDLLNEEKCYNKYLDLFTFAFDTGLRISELCGLTVSDFDFNKHSVHVTKQLQIYEDQSMHIVNLKTTYSERIIPLTARAEKAAKALINETANYRDVELDGYSGFVLLTNEGNLLNRRTLYKRYSRIIRKFDERYGTNLAEETTFHSIRHTFATRLANKGMAPKNLQYLMGHSKIETTLNIYAHVDIDTAFDSFFKLTQENETDS